MGYLYKREVEKLLIVSKIVFSAQKGLRGVARPCALLTFCVVHQMFLGPTWDANIAFPAVF